MFELSDSYKNKAYVPFKNTLQRENMLEIPRKGVSRELQWQW